MKTLMTILIPGALLLGAVTPMSASAQAFPAPAARAVSYADLDLRDPAGRGMLERRLRAAAREVCGITHGFDLRGRNDARECVAATLESVAIPQPDAFAANE